MWLANNVSIQWTQSILTTDGAGCTHTLLALQVCSMHPISSSDKGASSRGRGYSWTKATNFIRSIKGFIISKILQDQGILQVQEAAKLGFEHSFTPCHRRPMSSQTGRPTAGQGRLLMLTQREGSLLQSYGNRQTCCMLLYAHVYSPTDLCWASTAGSQTVFSEKPFCLKTFITDHKW